MAGTHSRLSASGAPAYSLCLGKSNAEEGLPDSTSEFAAEGTVFHEVAARCLELGMEPEDFIGEHFEEEGYYFVWDEHFCDNMHAGLDRVRELAAGNRLYVETRVSLAKYLGPGEAGTTDVGIVNVTDREVTIFDWKYGQGLPITPFDIVYDFITGEEVGRKINKQLGLYGLGFWEDVASKLLDPRDGPITFRLIIEQPRNDHGGGEYEVGLDDLLELGDEMRAVAKATKDPNAPRTPGEKQCYFCKRRKQPEGCYARNEMVLDLLGTDMEELDEDDRLGGKMSLAKPADLTPERRAFIQRNADSIRTFLKDLGLIVLNDALRGQPTPGLKAVAGRQPARKWKSSKIEEVRKKMVEMLTHDLAHKEELLSPTQLEAMIGETNYELKFRSFVDYGEAKPPWLRPHRNGRKSLLTKNCFRTTM